MGDRDETATIEALSRQFTEALRTRDFAAVGAMYANDAVVCPPNSNIITGKGNIQQFWERNRIVQSLSFDTVSVKVLGESTLRVVGTMSLQLVRPNARPSGGGPQQIKAKYVWVWQKIDGAWKIESGIWNCIGPARNDGVPAPSAISSRGIRPRRSSARRWPTRVGRRATGRRRPWYRPRRPTSGRRWAGPWPAWTRR